MKILAIETSCDETAMCLLEAMETAGSIDFVVHKNITHTQLEHKEYGGVFPGVAKREHIKNLPIILEEIMSGQEAPDVVCVTNGPGLEPALWCGIVFAKELGAKWNVPIIPVNHMEGHILSVVVPPLLAGEGSGVRFEFKNDIQFPALALLISGGHTELVLIKNIGDYEIIGKTRDDAVGEAFDKVARMLGLPYPGGPEISKLAHHFVRSPDALFRSDAEEREKRAGERKEMASPQFPRPMIHTKDYDFSFSGLKTAVLYYVQELLKSSPSHRGSRSGNSPAVGVREDQKIAIAHEFQEAVTEVLIKKTSRAIEEFGIQTLIVAGGVAANTRIISGLESMIKNNFPETAFMAPARELTGDNALMIALAGYFKIKKSPDVVYDNIRAEGNLSL